MSEPTSATLERVWGEQRRWSATADRLKSSIGAWRQAALVGLCLGVALEALAFSVDGPVDVYLAWAGAAALAAVPIIKASKLDLSRRAAWTRARSTSEALKHEVFRYRAGVAPYEPAGKADAALRTRADEILDQVTDLERYTTGVAPKTKLPPPPLSPADYVEDRVKDQADGYYEVKATQHAIRLNRVRTAEFVLGIGAATAGAAAAIVDPSSLAIWVGVLTTASGAVLAHAEASRYDHIVISYRTTARRLRTLLERYDEAVATDPDNQHAVFADLVNKCEQAISVENQGWMAAYVEHLRPAASPTTEPSEQ